MKARLIVPVILVAVIAAVMVLAPVAIAILPQTDPAPATAWRLPAPPGLPAADVLVVATVAVLALAQTVPRVLGYGRRHRQQANSFGYGSITRIARRLLVLGFPLRMDTASAYDIMTRWRVWPAPRFGV